jgi:hypothetical protein
MCATHLLNRIFQSEAAISGKHCCPWRGMYFLKLWAYMIMSGSWRAGWACYFVSRGKLDLVSPRCF